jgi:hypothetical protein
MINSDEIYWLCNLCLLNFFGNACTKSGPLRFPSFLVLTDCVSLLAYEFCISLWKIARCSILLLLLLFIYSWKQQKYRLHIWMRDNGICTINAPDNWDRGNSISTYLQLGRSNSMNAISMLYHVIVTIKVAFPCHHL